MEYHHITSEDNCFGGSEHVIYFKYNEYVVRLTNIWDTNKIAISTFNVNTNMFTPNKRLTNVNYDHLESVDYFYDDTIHGIVIDVKNKLWAHTVKYPHLVDSVDGNAVEVCSSINKEKYYIFHSKTYMYETGVFIFDVKTNTFNDEDFMKNPNYDEALDENDENYNVPKMTNIFTSLHDETIMYCISYNDNLIMLDTGNDICLYDVNNNSHHITNIINISQEKISAKYLWVTNLSFCDKLIFIINKNKICVFNIDDKSCKYVQICEENIK
jgi:hypothetical protein